ncbi:MAG: 30S ribosomal protein S16 [Candidatus Kerfeldbacteria bacterium]|jgi:small subunit ribosomal protein S16
MLTIRLSRFGKKKHPVYRVVISEHQKDTVGNYLELLGQYNPHTDTSELNEERIKYWISKGAQTSGTVHNLLVDKKIISAEKIKVANIKKKKEDDKAEGEAKPAAETSEKKPEVKETPKAEEKKEQPAEKIIDPKTSSEEDDKK